MLQVVELADLGVAAGQQFAVKMGGHAAHHLWRQLECDAVHAVAPGPEVVVCTVATLGQADEGALESVAVGIDEARQRRSGQAR
jgi:hypothetical protein